MVVDGGLHGTSSSLMEISRSLRHGQELSLPEHRKDFLVLTNSSARGYWEQHRGGRLLEQERW